MSGTRSSQVPTSDEFNALAAQVDQQGAQINSLDARVTALESAAPEPPDPEPPEPSGDYSFADEFTTLSLWNRDAPDDSKIWRPTRWWSPDEWDGWNCNAGRMVNPYNQPGCTQLYGVNADGQLFLAIDRTEDNHGDCKGQPFVTSQINQLSFRQRGGYWEARLKCPDIAGTNCAFWLMDDATWPPEVDIVEMVNFGDSHVMSQNLWNTDETTNPYYDFNCALTDWHTYAVWWNLDDNKIEFFFDGAHTQSVTPKGGYDQPMFVILSMQQGGDWSGPIPDNEPMGRLLFDYVRIATEPPGAVHSAPQAAPSGVLTRPRPPGSALGALVKAARGR